jgi:hypothetical protein
VTDLPQSGPLLLISLRKQDGSKIAIMQVTAATQDVALAQSLRKGVKYDFPKVLLGKEQKP